MSKQGDDRAFWVLSPGHGVIRPVNLPAPAAHEVLVRTLYSGVSRGTEALVFNGRVPPSERDRMRAPFQEGQFPGPVKYGYQNVGIVEAGPNDLLGRVVFTLFPHQTRFVVPTDAVHLLPPGVEPRRAVLTANLETAINGVWDAGVQIGDRIVVVGGGTVGCLVAWLVARLPGCRVLLVDVNDSRRRVAEALGVDFATSEMEADSATREAYREADLVFHTSGTPAGLTTALGTAGCEATIVEMSWFGDQAVSVPLGQAFHVKRLTLRSSQVGTLPPSRRTLWTHRRRMALALDLAASPVLDVLITGESPFDALPDLMPRLATSPGDTICHAIRYD